MLSLASDHCQVCAAKLSPYCHPGTPHPGYLELLKLVLLRACIQPHQQHGGHCCHLARCGAPCRGRAGRCQAMQGHVQPEVAEQLHRWS